MLWGIYAFEVTLGCILAGHHENRCGSGVSATTSTFVSSKVASSHMLAQEIDHLPFQADNIGRNFACSKSRHDTVQVQTSIVKVACVLAGGMFIANFSSPLKASVATMRPLCICKVGLDIGCVPKLLASPFGSPTADFDSESLAPLHLATWSASAVGTVNMTAANELQEPDLETPSSPSRVPHTSSSIRPSVKYVEVEGPNKGFLRQVLAPPRPVLPRKQSRSHAPPAGLRQRVPLSSSLTGKWLELHPSFLVAVPIQDCFCTHPYGKTKMLICHNLTA